MGRLRTLRCNKHHVERKTVNEQNHILTFL